MTTDPVEAVALLPCPFCIASERRPKVRDNGRDGCGPTDTWWVQCRCGAEGPNARDATEAITAWNTRAALAAAPTEQVALDHLQVARDKALETMQAHRKGDSTTAYFAGCFDALDVVLKEIRALAGKPLPSDGWKDIATAPKDHFPMLTWSVEVGRCVAFKDVTGTWFPIPATCPLGSPPTHWRPLPASPEKT